MLRRLILYLLVELMLLAVAVSADRWYKDTEILQQYAVQISTYVSQQSADAQQWLKSKQPNLTAYLTGQSGAGLTPPEEQDYTILVHYGDSVAFWSNNHVVPAAAELERLSASAYRGCQALSTGFYHIVSEPIANGATATVLVPLRYANESTWTGQRNLFPASASIPAQVQVLEQPTNFPVKVSGADCCWLDAAGNAQPVWVQWLKLLCYGLFFLVLLTMLNQAARLLSLRTSLPLGAVLMIVSVALLVFLNGQFGFARAQFGNLPLFAQPFSTASYWGNSLGDWLIYTGLLLWLLIYLQREFSAGKLRATGMPLRFALACALYFLMGAGVVLGVSALEQLVGASPVYFNFDNILNAGNHAYLAMGGVLLLLCALYLLHYRLMLALGHTALERSQRWMAMGGGVALTLLLALLWPDLHTSALLLAAILLVYFAVFEYLRSIEIAGFAETALWLMAFSALSANVLYRANENLDGALRMQYARALASEKDEALLEPALLRIRDAVASDTRLNMLLMPWPFKPERSAIRDHLNRLVFRENYVFQHYRFDVYAFDKGTETLLQGQTRSYQEVVQEYWGRGQQLGDAADVRYVTGPDGIFRYMTRTKALRMNDPTQETDLYCFFEHEYPKPTRVYSELFYSSPYKQLDRLQQYDFSVLKKGSLLIEQGQSNLAAARVNLDAGEGREIASEGRSDAVYKSADGFTVAAVGRGLGGWYKQLYLFAILFALSSLLMFGAVLANTYLRFLPGHFQFYFSTKGSLARRIHYWYVALVAAVFVVIGLLTWTHFTESARQADQKNLDFRAEAILTNLRTQLGALSPASDSLRRVLPAVLGIQAGSLSVDANLFDPAGDLIYSTREDLAKQGVIPAKMGTRAFAVLAGNTQASATETEQAAGFEYATRYMALRNNQNQLLAFVGVPYHLKQRKIGVEVSDFIGALATLYVFLLLIAFVVTYFLARSIIRPVSLISEKIKVLRLEDQNLPLEYHGGSEDEISELIHEYNRMVDKLEDSKTQLIRLEREGAWREMARQVAHDIKNPLTTMKLSMQQLERVSSDPVQAAAYLKKAITRLIEQIDSLAQIASEFSMFANLDIREKHDMVLNEVVESVYDLFSEQKGVDHSLKLPPERYHISGDKNHLIRVFNNLVINAMQAIPSDRRGNIRVTMFRRNGQAVVQISDNGGGIPPEIQKRVFEPNFTTKTSGSGLGLAICRKIIEALDGSINFETRENEGTDFFVELPITKVDY